VIRTGLIWTSILIGMMSVIAVCVRIGISEAEIVPVHWNAAGEADGFASSSGAMVVYWILIGTAVFMGGIFAALPMMSMVRDDILKFRKLYLSIWLGTVGLLVVLMAVIGWVTYASVSNVPSPPADVTIIGLVRSVLALSSVGLMALGNYFPKTRQNNVMGIRTAKTLSDTENWERTHRYAGKVFVLAGMACFIIACFVPLLVAVFIWSLPLLVACFLSYGYSNKI